MFLIFCAVKSMIKKVKIFSFHLGKSYYIKEFIDSCTNSDLDVILACDSYDKNYFKNPNLTILSDKIKDNEVKALWSHFISDPFKLHLHTDKDYSMQALSFFRWFRLYDYMLTYDIDDNELVFHVDSDIFFSNNFVSYANYITSKVDFAAIHEPKNLKHLQMAASGHMSLWSRSSLKSLVDYFCYPDSDDIEQMKEKWKYHVEHNKSGGICDMTYLYLWRLRNSDRVLNISELSGDRWAYNDTVNIYGGNNTFSTESLKVRNGLIYRSDDKEYAFLHFQGRSKKAFLFTSIGFNPSLALKFANYLNKLLSIMRRIYIRKFIGGAEEF